MSIKSSGIGNLPIITLNNGVNINTVKDVIYDSMTNQVKALLVDEKGWFKGAKILLLTDIKSIGKDAITIDTEDCIINSDDNTDMNIGVIVNEDNYLTKNKVITESGTELGRVTDLYFDFPSGNVIELEVSSGFLKNLTSGTKKIQMLDIVKIGKDNLIVKDSVEQSLEHQDPVNGAAKVINDTKSKAHDILDATVSKSQEILEGSKAKISEVVNSNQAQDAMENVKNVSNNVKDKVSNSINNTKEDLQSTEPMEKIHNGIDSGVKEVKKVIDNSNIVSSQPKDDLQVELNKKS